MSRDDLRPCPFCGGQNLKTGGDDKVVGVWCSDCEATGPNHYGRHEWNDRPELALADKMVALIREWEPDNLTDENCRDWFGHIEPSISAYEATRRANILKT